VRRTVGVDAVSNILAKPLAPMPPPTLHRLMSQPATASAAASASPREGVERRDSNISSSQELDVTLALPGQPKMHHVGGHWVSDAKAAAVVADSSEAPSVEQVQELRRTLAELEGRVVEIEDKRIAATEENALLSLRNKMLVEMLAIAQLDVSKAM
jgi:hypothetical protein